MRITRADQVLSSRMLPGHVAWTIRWCSASIFPIFFTVLLS